ncbi:CHAT domain-containing protein [Rhizobium leguminosarum]|uniref:CHAT domain-containing protein n=1 Tax=Rhizobium leguminosarum TaxID=384 RepID=UPI001C94B9DD|nr:CHAT domain-containing protein [Rhizobium leguminosarum]MBY5716395.1 CHAT domain-containing protein [Rhizobium leguminosarum]
MRIERLDAPRNGYQALKLILDGQPAATAVTKAMLPEALRQDLGWLFERLPYALSGAEHARLALIGEQLSKLGIQLFADLFDAGEVHRTLWRNIKADIDRLRIEIIEPPQTLPELPWELMRRGLPDVPLGRRVAQFVYMPPASVPVTAPATLPDRRHKLFVLLIIARPQSVADVAYRAAAYDIVERYAQSSDIVFEILRPATFAALQSRLQRGPAPDIVHFDGHGTLTQFGKSLVGVVLFDSIDHGTSPVRVRGSALAKALLAGGVKTLVLHACRSAQSPDWQIISQDGDDALIVQPAPSFATEVAKQALTVIAMRYLVPVSIAVQFASSFYGHVSRTRAVVTALSLTVRDLYETTHDSAPWSWLIPALIDASPPGFFGAATAVITPQAITVAPDPRPHWDPAFRFLDICFGEPGPVAILAPLGFDSLAIARSYARWFDLTGPINERQGEPTVLDFASIPDFETLARQEAAPFVIVTNMWAAFDEVRGRWPRKAREQFADLADHWAAQGKRILLLATDPSQIPVRPRAGGSVVPQFFVRNPFPPAALSIVEIAGADLSREDAYRLFELCEGLPELAANVLTDVLAATPFGDRHEHLLRLARNGLSLKDAATALPAFPSIAELEAALPEALRHRLALLVYFRNFVRHDVLAEFEARTQGVAPFTQMYERRDAWAPILQRVSHLALLIDLENNGYRIHPLARAYFEKWWADRLVASTSPREDKALVDDAFCGAVADLAAMMAGGHGNRKEAGALGFALEAGNIQRAFDIAMERSDPYRASQCLWALELAQKLGNEVGFTERALLAKRTWSGLSMTSPPDGMLLSNWLSLRLRMSRIATGSTSDEETLAEQTAILCATWPAVLKYRRLIGNQPLTHEARHAFEVWLGTLSVIFVTSKNGRLPSPATPRRLERAEQLSEQLDLKHSAALFCQYLALLNYGRPPNEDADDGNLDESGNWAKRAAELDPTPQNLVASQFRLGMIFIKRAYQLGMDSSDFRTAREFFQQALYYSGQETEFGESGVDLSDVYRELMFVARQLRDLPGIEDAYRNAVRYALERGDPYSAARTKGNHAAALYDLGRNAAAMQYRAEAIRDLHAIGHPEALELAAWYEEQWAIQDNGG